MEANQKNFDKFLKDRDTKFIIPVYQRNYDWKNIQCKKIFEDIIKVGNSDRISHFIGRIVFIHDSVYKSGSITELVIIDGQQRITTLTLLWIAILEKAKEFGYEKLVKTIPKNYLINEDFDEEEKLKLRPTANNSLILKGIIKDGKNFEYDEFSNLTENFNYFFEHITEGNIDIIIQGIQKLLFVEVSLERGKDDPQRIFESLNSTGLDLSEADLIRNYILIDLPAKIQENFYNDYWQEIEKNTKLISNNQSKVDEFIRDYLTLRFKEIPNKKKIYQEFKEHFNFQNNEEKENELIHLKKYSKHYNKLLNPQNETDNEIRKQIELVNLLEVTVVYPFLLQVYQDYNSGLITKDKFIEVLKIVQSFVFRQFIVELPTNALNKIFKDLYHKIDKDDYIKSLQFELIRKPRSQRFPDNTEIKEELKHRNLYKINPNKRKFLFLQLENYSHKEPISISDYTIEHIFPQNPDSKWKLHLSQAEYTEMEDKYINTISNLTLTAYNPNYSNKVFSDKRDMEKGFKESHLFLNKFIAKCERWNLETLNERFEIIYNQFCNIWEYPEITINKDETIDEQNIFDIQDPTGKKVDYIVFYKNKIPVKTNKEILEIVVRELFNLEPTTFIGTELGESLRLTKNPDVENRYSQMPNNKYFIYTWLSSKEIFKKLELVLIAFKWYDELYIKFKEPNDN